MSVPRGSRMNRLLFRLPVWFHTLLARLSGGWRIVAWRSNPGGTWGHHWERWR